MNTKALIIMADGFEEIEAVTVIDILRRADISVQAVSIMDKLEVSGAHGIKLICDIMFEHIPDNAEILILPGGGPGTQNMKNHRGLCEKLKKFNDDKKWIAAVCAAPTVLEELGILKGKSAVCFPSCEQQIKSALIAEGAVEVCENVITSKAAGTTAEFALKIAELLKDKKTADNLKNEMLIMY